VTSHWDCDLKEVNMAEHKVTPRTANEADQLGHSKASNFNLVSLGHEEKQKGVHMSAQGAKPGDVAWMGPCVAGIRIVCYYDQNMDPSDCRNQPC